MHYCEIPDYKPVVLPLGGKQSSDQLFMITDNIFPLVVGATETQTILSNVWRKCYCLCVHRRPLVVVIHHFVWTRAFYN
jgi:hypothetical protein